MDDTKLLEDAARAIGRSIQGWNTQHGEAVAVLDDCTFWQPLHENHVTDCMGDALRLAVKVRLLIACEDCCAMGPNGRVQDDWFGGAKDPHVGVSHDVCDPYAHTRRAIVRAAAAIGKEMK